MNKGHIHIPLFLSEPYPLDDPFCPYKVFGVLEVFNEALSIFVHNLPIVFHCGASSFLTLCHVSATAQHQDLWAQRAPYAKACQ